jgi:hypothetical protein
MRLLLAGFLFACAIAFAADTTLAPNSEEFHKLYGDPVSAWKNWDGNPDSESFALRPDIHLTVIYGSDHGACIVKLEPKIPTHPEEHYHLMSTERISEILDETAPPAKRGKLNDRSGEFCAGSPGIGIYDYERVLITRYLKCMEPNSESLVTMAFRRAACPKPQ